MMSRIDDYIDEVNECGDSTLLLSYPQLLDLQDELQKVKQERDGAVMQSIGWMYAYCCTLADKGVDIRKLEVPVIMEDFAKTQHGAFLNKIGDD